jgi:hypothetical protein
MLVHKIPKDTLESNASITPSRSPLTLPPYYVPFLQLSGSVYSQSSVVLHYRYYIVGYIHNHLGTRGGQIIHLHFSNCLHPGCAYTGEPIGYFWHLHLIPGLLPRSHIRLAWGERSPK